MCGASVALELDREVEAAPGGAHLLSSWLMRALSAAGLIVLTLVWAACGDDAASMDGGTTRDAANLDVPVGADSEPITDPCSTILGTPTIPTTLSIQTNGGADFTTASPWLVLTGTSAATGGPITVNGSERAVRRDASLSTWSWLGPLEAEGENTFAVTDGADTRMIHVTLSTPPAAERAATFGAGAHFVGSWLFSWFNGDTSWECQSAWWPVDGFAAWDGSIAWARAQILDAMDAGIDVLGLQYDTMDPTLSWGRRFTNLQNVLRAWRELLDEGYRPPRLMMFLDTAIVNELYRMETGSDLDVSTAAGRDAFYEYVQTFEGELASIFGPRFIDAARARYDDRPMLAFWHTSSGSITGASEAFAADLKARYMADYGVEPYVVAHPNDWRTFTSTDEVTQMFGPPMHFFQSGRDGAGKPTINITPGFWNPTSNPFYLPREGGTHYEDAWTTALAHRAESDHLYIDSWNETGEGSGLFAAQPRSYGASDRGSCGTWINPHDEAWGADARAYIRATAARSAEWNDLPDEDATLVAHDLPAHLAPGEWRLVTVVMRNTGDRAWGEETTLGLASASEGLVRAPSSPTPARAIPPYAGVARGMPEAFTFPIAACASGDITLQLRGPAGLFGGVASTTLVLAE